MSHIRRSLAATPLPGVVVGAVAGGAFSALALADAGARPLHLAVVKLQITSVTGRSDLCSLAQSTAVGDGTSYLSTGSGSFQAALTIDFSAGGSCGIVDEPPVLTFGNGTIFTCSHQEDCAIHGLRIDTAFQVTGGPAPSPPRTAAATDSPRRPGQAPVIFNRPISF